MDSMEIDDNIYIDKNLTMESLISQGGFQRRKQHSRCVPVCLGLLCAVLLAGNIGQIIYYEIISCPASTDLTQANYSTLTQGDDSRERDRLQSRSEALTAERKQLEARLRDLTKQKDLLQQSYNSLTAERDELKDSFSNLKIERDQVQASYHTLKQESDQLHTRYNDVQRNLEGLKIYHNNLTASKDQLQSNYSNLQREKDDLHALFAQLQKNYTSLKKDKDQLQKSYNTLNITNNLLETSYSSLWKDREQLQTVYKTLQREKEQLQTNYSNLVTDRDQLKKKIDKVRPGIPCQTNWRKFDTSCYFVSTVKKNWMLGRQDCITQGADLVIIDSLDEQAFISGLLGLRQNAWIGLTDSLEEGTWMWVDGTPITTAYWQPGQPNSFNGNQDCGEILPKSLGLGEWNDDGCFAEQIWICEK